VLELNLNHQRTHNILETGLLNLYRFSTGSVNAALSKCISIIAVTVGLWLASTAPPAQAQGNLPIRPVKMRFEAETLRLSFAVDDFVDAKVEEKLESGLPQTLITRVVAYAEGETRARAATAVSCRVVYDLWEGSYRVERQLEGSEELLRAKDVASVVGLCLSATQLSLGSGSYLAKLRGKEIFIVVSVDLNPVSTETVKRIQRWLAKPGGNDLEGNAFFGSFVGIFVGRDLGEPDKRFTFRSAAIRVP
jgi:hypothetical protein